MTYLTPPQVAKLLRVRRDKVVTWIQAGKLRAIDVADTGQRHQYRIAPADLERFDAARAVVPARATPRRQQPAADEIQYLE